VFGIILLYSGVKVLRHKENESSPDGHRKMMSRIERFIPVTDEYDGHKFFTKSKGKRTATPLLAALIAVELTDIVFAVDSVPAILAVSREPYLVIASNAFAILGLRALYFLLADAKDRFHYLSHALGAVLIFVGTKMIASHWWHMPTAMSLSVILALLVSAITASVLKNRHTR
jgi:tellurite resistance protein TerC